MTSNDRTIAVRLDRPDAFCQGCEARLRIGQPSVNEAWPYRLREKPMTQTHINLLLQAAAEFDLISQKAGLVGTAVEFMDWATPDALGLLSQVYPEFAGIAVTETGGSRIGASVTRHAQPFPLPHYHVPERKRSAS